jgi:hypothetical protein
MSNNKTNPKKATCEQSCHECYAAEECSGYDPEGYFECDLCHEMARISELHIDPDDKMLCTRCHQDEPYESRVSQ